MPWVRKCVLRLSWVSKQRPHTLQESLPSGACCAAPSRGLRGPGSSGSPALFFFLWVMKRWRLRETWEVKQSPHSRHWWELSSVRCWGMCSWKSAELLAR